MQSFIKTLILLPALCGFAALPVCAQSADPRTADRQPSGVEDNTQSLIRTFAERYGVEPELPLAIVSALGANSKLAEGRLGPMGINPSYARLLKMNPGDLRNAKKSPEAGCFLLKKLVERGKRKGKIKNPAALFDEEIKFVLLDYARGPLEFDKPDGASEQFVREVMQARDKLKQERPQPGGEGGSADIHKKFGDSAASASNSDSERERRVNAMLPGGTARAGWDDGAGLKPQSGDMGSLAPAGNGGSPLFEAMRSYPPLIGTGMLVPVDDKVLAGKVASKSVNKYNDLIRKYAGSNKLDQRLVKSLIAEESVFDSSAVSPAGAIGLMQLKPATARDMAKRVGIKNFKTAQLKDPEMNIRLGTEYLVWLFEMANRKLGSSGEPAQQPQWVVERVLASYNAGPSVMGNSRPAYGVREYVSIILGLRASHYIEI